MGAGGKVQSFYFAWYAATFVMMTLRKYPERLAVPGCKLVAGQQRARTHSSWRGTPARALRVPFELYGAAAENIPKSGS
jgi:hypothetical protein